MGFYPAKFCNITKINYFILKVSCVIFIFRVDSLKMLGCLLVRLTTTVTMMSTGKTNLFEWMTAQLYDDDSAEGLDILLNEISSLPRMQEWMPTNGGMYALDVLCLAATLKRIKGSSCQTTINKVIQSILTNETIAPDDYSELSAAAIFSNWVDKVQSLLTRRGIKTLDFKAFYSNCAFELEVTNSNEKDEQIKRKSFAHNLSEKISVLNLKSDFCIRYVDILTNDEVTCMLDKALGLIIGASVEESGRWYIEAKYPAGKNVLLEPANSQWRSPYASSALFHTSVAIDVLEGNTVGMVQNIDIQWFLSTKSYINSLSKKKDAEQATGDLPFVVACDVTQLPGAFGWYSDNLNSHFSDWSNLISAIILFRRSVHGLDILKWEFIFFKNPNSTNPFPEYVQIPNEGFVAQHFYE